MAGAMPAWRRRDPLFDYPLSLPGDTVYRELDIELDAADAEVKWAKALRSEELKAEQGELEKKMEEVYSTVGGLRAAYGKVDALDPDRGEGDSEELRHALRRLRELEREAERIDPAFRRDRERVAEIDGQIRRLNSLGLDNPDQRNEYDRARPPLALLRRTDGTAMDLFDDVRTCLFLLRKELSAFLAKRTGEAFHASDLTREDFSYEFTRNDLLDGGQR